LPAGRQSFPPPYFVIASRSDGDGPLEASDAPHCWPTDPRGVHGAARFTHGIDEVTIRAFDFAATGPSARRWCSSAIREGLPGLSSPKELLVAPFLGSATGAGCRVFAGAGRLGNPR